MIDMNELKPILEPLLEGREDSADIIEQVAAIDRTIDPPQVDRSEIDALNASWNERFKKAFFGSDKADSISEEIPSVPEVSEEEPVEEEKPLTYENLFTEVKEDDKED